MSKLALYLINEAFENRSPFLDLGNCGLREVPKEIVILRDTLQHLNLGSWYLANDRYTRSVNRFENNNIYYRANSLTLLQELPFLQSLYLSNNAIGGMGAKYVGQLSSLTTLDLTNNEIGEKGIKYLLSLSNIVSLDLSSNNIGSHGASIISEFSSLTSLNVGNNQLEEAGTKHISGLSSLTSLKVHNNQIGSQGAVFLSQLSCLTSLDIGNNRIGDLGAEYLSRLSSLTSLNIERNYINNKGAEYVSRLSSLTTLNIERNQIDDKGAKYISRLSSLASLNLANNEIGDEGAEYISRLSSLTSLDLNNNQIGDQGAKSLSRIPSLTELCLSNNKIASFNFIASPYLKTLLLQNNLIESLSFELVRDIRLDVDIADGDRYVTGKIFLRGNPIKNIPPEVLNKGRNAILEYLGGPLRPLNECKLIFVGDGSVGKTSLMKRLVYDKFSECEITTHGINKIAWKGITNERGEPIKINCWDFGGQHIQHSLHQFFFTERVVYVLVLNPRNDERAGYWLDQVDKLGRNSQIIIVYNWKDKEDIQADYLRNFRELRKTYKYLPKPITVSCAIGEGMAEFVAAVKQAVLANEGLKIEYPKPWFNIKEKLETLIPIERHYIEYAQYEKWCEEEGYNDPQKRRNLLQILDSVGAIVFFDKPVLNELQVLNPEWITTGAYAILTSDIARKKKGHLTWKDLRIIFNSEKEIFSNKNIRIKYEEPQFKFILQLMIDYWLCQENPFVQHEFLIPVSFGEKPNKEYNISDGRHYRLKFQSSFEMLIIHRFIAKNILNIVSNDYWNSGIYFKHATSATFALVETNQYSQVIDCWIKGENIRGMWEVIRNDFREIFNMYHNFPVDEEVEYPTEERAVFFKYDEMLAAMRNNVMIIPYDIKTGLKDIDVLDVLELFEPRVQTAKSIYKEQISVEVNPQITVSPQITNNPVLNSHHPILEASVKKLYDQHAEDKKVKRWKGKAFLTFGLSAAITITLLLIWYKKLILAASTWHTLEQFEVIKWLGLVLGMAWNGFIVKSLYDRILDPSKEKAYREKLRK